LLIIDLEGGIELTLGPWAVGHNSGRDHSQDSCDRPNSEPLLRGTGSRHGIRGRAQWGETGQSRISLRCGLLNRDANIGLCF
jgi:hypothetical protein